MSFCVRPQLAKGVTALAVALRADVIDSVWVLEVGDFG